MKLKNLRPRSREALALGCQHFCILLQVEHADPMEILQGGAAENWGINYVQLDNAFLSCFSHCEDGVFASDIYLHTKWHVFLGPSLSSS